ncbi:hypothetical protein [Xanthomonas phaseoli]|uniref:hypothetical protein n=1 Tax=Xanthomonas phaseoli TaxID=1985254 RepID=UPI00126761A5|nr:hypothetical protein [Xanthomonas phaseoli]
MNSINLRSFAVALGKNKIFFGVAIISILGCAIGVAVADGGGKNYSFGCGGCDLGSPMPTTTTLNAINQNYELNIRNPNQTLMYTDMHPGDTVTVCNGSACVTYTYNSSGNYLGAPPVPQVRNPPRGGGGDSHSGGGSFSGGGGGVGIGSGGSSGGSGGGRVEVGPPTEAE